MGYLIEGVVTFPPNILGSVTFPPNILGSVTLPYFEPDEELPDVEAIFEDGTPVIFENGNPVYL